MIYGDYLQNPVQQSLSVRALEASKPVTFEFLADLYKAEQKDNLQASTVKEIAT
jgi:hypothetical protein